MQDEKFRRALHEAMMRDYQNRTVPEEPHAFSEEFEQKMEQLIRRREKPWYRITHTWVKRVACVAAVAAASSSMLLHTDAQRGRYEDFGVTISSEWTHVVPGEVNDDAPRTIEDEYRITYDLSGYEMEYHFQEAADLIFVRYMQGENEVDFSQDVKWNYRVGHNTEFATFDQAYVHDREAICFKDRFGHYNLIWMNEEYIFKISTNLGKSAAIEIAESVQKVEK